jgi:hypothetical protein
LTQAALEVFDGLTSGRDGGILHEMYCAVVGPL